MMPMEVVEEASMLGLIIQLFGSLDAFWNQFPEDVTTFHHLFANFSMDEVEKADKKLFESIIRERARQGFRVGFFFPSPRMPVRSQVMNGKEEPC
jgi:hypothetical protein